MKSWSSCVLVQICMLHCLTKNNGSGLVQRCRTLVYIVQKHKNLLLQRDTILKIADYDFFVSVIQPRKFAEDLRPPFGPISARTSLSDVSLSHGTTTAEIVRLQAMSHPSALSPER